MSSIEIEKVSRHGETDKMKPVAVVGLACRYPGDATSPSAFYDLLIDGRSAWSEVPKNRYNIDSYWHPNKDRIGTTTARGGHWLKGDPAYFDAPFFSMTASEAAAHDPQLRMLLECAFECLEDSGTPIESLAGSDTSVFVASSSSEYPSFMLRDEDNIPTYAAVGSGTTMLANRLSHFYDLRGPSIAIDTACSGGLVAVHLGCQAIRNGDSKTSLVGASQLILTPSGNLALNRLQFLSPDSRCFTFDDRANGYARGEGICVLMLKELEQALQDGDTVRAIIRGSGTNQDGKTPGIVQPSSKAQASLIRQTYAAAGIDCSGTNYVEAHGTGTQIGDPLEMTALAESLQTELRDRDRPLYVGSVKTNVGHLEGGAGLAGLLKTILSLENSIIFPNANFENPNPRLRLDDWRIKIATKATPWPSSSFRRASVNSFGYGGSNAHCIVDNAYDYLRQRGIAGNTATTCSPYDVQRWSEDDYGRRSMTSNDSHEAGKRPMVFVFSSPEQAALQRLATIYADHIDAKLSHSLSLPIHYLDYLAYTLGTRRSIFQWRTAVIANSLDQLATKLREPVTSHRTNRIPDIVYCFTGQGAQWYAMGRELLQYSVFRQTLLDAETYLKHLGADWSVMDELLATEEESKLDLAKYSQPLCVILQTALVRLLSQWGVRPLAVIGHSSGEVAAAYAAGYISAEHCWKVAYHRGRLSNDLEKIAPDKVGSMMAVGLSQHEAIPYLERLEKYDDVVIACINSPSSITLSGDVTALTKLEASFKANNTFTRKLQIKVAYHSPHMKVIVEQYYEAVKDIKVNQPETAPLLFSTVTGSLIDGVELNASYWVRNMVSPVQFAKALEALISSLPATSHRKGRDGHSADVMLEIGPHSALQGPLRQILTKVGKIDKFDYLSMLIRRKDAAVTSLEALRHLWIRGAPVKLLKVNIPDASPAILQSLSDLPRYPWNHTNKYWHEDAYTRNHRFREMPRLDLVGAPVADWNPYEPRFKNTVRTSDIPWLSDHIIQDVVIYPAASMLCAVLEATYRIPPASAKVEGFELREVTIGPAIVVPLTNSGVSTSLHLSHSPDTRATESSRYKFSLYSEPKDDLPVQHCSGLIQIEFTSREGTNAETPAFQQHLKKKYSRLHEDCTKAIKPERFYEAWASVGLQWGLNFQGLTDIHCSELAACVTVTVKDTQAVMPARFEYDHLLHPTTLESCFQASYVPSIGAGKARVPTIIKSLYVSTSLPKKAGSKFTGYATLSCIGCGKYSTDIVMDDATLGQPKIIVSGMEYTALHSESAAFSAGKEPWKIRKLCSQVSYKEDLDHIRQAEADVIFDGDDQPIETWIQLSGHKRPSQRVLQINCGDFSLTQSILNRLGGKSGSTPWFGRYVVTHSDARMLAFAQELFHAWDGGQVIYKVLNLSESFLEQGIELNDFDTVLMGYTTNQPSLTDPAILRRCFDVLRPGGKLVLGRAQLSLQEVEGIFDSLNLGAIEIFLETRNHSAMVVSTKAIDPCLDINNITILLPTKFSEEVGLLAKSLVQKLSELDARCEISDLEKITTADNAGIIPASNTRVISLIEVETPFVSNLSETDFYALRTLLSRGCGGLWITRSCMQLDPTGDPAFCDTSGLLRCARTERPDIPMFEFSLSSKLSAGDPKAVDMIIKGFMSMYEAESAGNKPEPEFAELNGRIYIPRLQDYQSLNDHLDKIGKPPTTEMQNVFQKNRPLKLEIGTPGQLNTLHFVDDDQPAELLTDHEVEVEVFASGINLTDSMVITGSLTDTELGVDAAGIITRTGRNVIGGLKSGDRVATFCRGAFRNIVHVQDSLVAKLPDEMTLEEGAAVPCVYSTAYYALFSVGHLGPGELILINDAAGDSDLGQAAIQLAQYVGATIFVAAGTTSQRRFLMNEYKIPSYRILNSCDMRYSQEVKHMTDGRGVDVVLNSSSGETLRVTWECISDFGRFLDVAKNDILSNTGLGMGPFQRNVTYAGINFAHMARADNVKAGKILHDCFNLMYQGRISLIRPIKVYKWSEMEEAFRTVQQAEHVGKMVFKVGPDDRVPVIPRQVSVKLDGDATYVVAGGLGGIGRSIVIWLAELGAKHVAIISRSGILKSEARATMDELLNMGVVAKSYCCDIVDPKAFSATVERIHAESPAIKGALHCAMIVNDCMLDTTTYEQWSQTNKVKVQGAWNMHTYLPKGLDFFIMMSSASGYIGTPKLASYASGNTYNDGLAQHRRALGLKACAPGFGFVAGMGWVRDNVKISDVHKADWELMVVPPAQVLSIIKSAISGHVTSGIPMPPQFATVMGTGGELQQTKLIKTRDWFNDPKFFYLAQLDVQRNISRSETGGAPDVKTALASATSLAQAAEIVEDALAMKLAHSMSMAPEDLDSSKPVSAYGVDSLVSMEIRNWIGGALKSNTALFDVLDSGPIEDLAAKIAENSILIPESLRPRQVKAST